MATGTPSIAETPSGAISRSSTLSSGHSATPCFASSRIVVAEVVEACPQRVLAYRKFDTCRLGVTPWRRGTPVWPLPFLLLPLLVLAPAARGQPFEGTVIRVVDGDTIY